MTIRAKAAQGGDMQLLARAGPARQFVAYLEHIGLETAAVVPAHARPKEWEGDPGLLISARVIIELMDAAAKRIDAPDLALRFVEWMNPKSLGPLSWLYGHVSSLADATEAVSRYLDAENNAIRYEVAYIGDEVWISHDVVPACRARADQFLLGSTALSVREWRGLLGARWRPIRVLLPASARFPEPACAEYFGCPVATHPSGNLVVVLDAKDFDRSLERGQPEIRSLIEEALQRRASSWSSQLPEVVARSIAEELSSGRATLETVAGRLAKSPRSLQRELSELGTSYREILRSVRLEIVADYLAAGDPPGLATLAERLGFSEPSAVSRFMRSALGTTVRDLEREQPAHSRQAR